MPEDYEIVDRETGRVIEDPTLEQRKLAAENARIEEGLLALRKQIAAQSAAEITEAPNSCEISVNAKGDLTFKVKAYGTTLAAAMMIAQEAAVEMRAFATKKEPTP